MFKTKISVTNLIFNRKNRAVGRSRKKSSDLDSF